MDQSAGLKISVLKAFFFLGVLLMPIDGFYLGIKILREFGARPVNFILLLTAIFFLGNFLRDLKSFINHSSPYPLIFLILIIFGTINIFIPLFYEPPTVLDRPPVLQWFFQYSMYLWFFCSILIWIFLFKELKLFTHRYSFFIKVLIIATIANLAFFFFDYFLKIWTGSSNPEILYFLRGKIDPRPSGFSTEPSLFGSWVAFIWPLLFFVNKNYIRSKFKIKLAKSLAILSILAGILSFSRTFLAIFLIQIAAFYFLSFNLKSFFRKLIYSVTIVAFGIIFAFTLLAQKFLSIFDVSSNFSSMTRIGSTIAAVNALINFPFFGIGLGQFTAYYSDFVPGWALTSYEVQNYMAGETNFRVNAFNLPARLGAELGVISLLFWLGLFVFIGWTFFKKIRTLVGRGIFPKFFIGSFLSFLGGISWWLTQDLFGYQPGLFVIALAIYFLTMVDYPPSPSRSPSPSPSPSPNYA